MHGVTVVLRLATARATVVLRLATARVTVVLRLATARVTVVLRLATAVRWPLHHARGTWDRTVAPVEHGSVTLSAAAMDGHTALSA
jgi:hypothetical protein